jgi:hypothetical protein
MKYLPGKELGQNSVEHFGYGLQCWVRKPSQNVRLGKPSPNLKLKHINFPSQHNFLTVLDEEAQINFPSVLDGQVDLVYGLRLGLV